MSHQPSTSSRFARLADVLSGTVITPADDAYDSARRIWNGDIDRRPAALAQCLTADDVAAAVRFGVDEGLEIAVRSGGHSFPGLSVADDALVIDLRHMREVHELPGHKFAAQGGCLLGDLDRPAAAAGRAIPAGVVSHTGIAGLTLGGGYGYLSRQWGLTCDHLTEVELVQADGSIVTVTDESDPELMWGLRGGGGNWGVATKFTYSTRPLKQVLAGWILHPFERAQEFSEFYREFVRTMPREMCILLRLKMDGNTAFLAPELQGADKKYIGMLIVWSGDLAAGEEALRPLRGWGKAMHDDVRPQPYPDVQSGIDAGARHGVGRYERAGYLSELSEPAIAAGLAALTDPPTRECEVSMFSLGGAIGDLDDNATAYSSRKAEFAFEVRTAWTDPAQRSALVDWNRATWAAIDTHAMAGVYVNLVMDEGGDRIRKLYGDEKYDRLARLKARVDPDNVFHLNQNIIPALAPVTA